MPGSNHHPSNRYICPHCAEAGDRFETPHWINFQMHVREEHPGKPVSVARAKGNLDLPHNGPFECPNCGEERKTLSEIAVHIRVKHKIEDTEIAEYGVTRMIRRFECELGFEAWLWEQEQRRGS